MKTTLLTVLTLIFCFSANASYTPSGYSIEKMNAVSAAITDLASREFATNRWPGYEVQSITFSDGNEATVLVVDQWNDVGSTLSFVFEVTEKSCELSACGFEANLKY